MKIVRETYGNQTHYGYYDENEYFVFHREDGPAVIYSDGEQKWYIHGKYHREDGPAIFFADGTQEWWFNGKVHREDGPAFFGPDGIQEWLFYGKEITNKVEYWLKDHNIDDWKTMTDEDKIALGFFMRSL